MDTAAEYTMEEKLLLPKFREKVAKLLEQEHHRTDKFLVKWLRDQDLNLNAATSMLKKYFAWRQTNKIDSILTEEIDELVKQICPYEIDSCDTDGRPVLDMLGGHWRLRDIVENGKREHFYRFGWKMMEELETAAINNRKIPGVSQAVGLIDLEGLSYKQLSTKAALGVFVHFIGTLCDYYPEIMHSCYIINAPAFFKIIFRVLKAVIPSRYAARINMYGKDRSEWEPVLLSVISSDQLRIRYGGTKHEKCLQ